LQARATKVKGAIVTNEASKGKDHRTAMLAVKTMAAADAFACCPKPKHGDANAVTTLVDPLFHRAQSTDFGSNTA